jgi:hypothetical protein
MSVKSWVLGACAAILLCAAAQAAPLRGLVGFFVEITFGEVDGAPAVIPDVGFSQFGGRSPSGADFGLEDFAGLPDEPFLSFAPILFDPEGGEAIVSGFSFSTAAGSFAGAFEPGLGGFFFVGRGVFTPSPGGPLAGFSATPMEFLMLSTVFDSCRGSAEECTVLLGALQASVPTPAALALFGAGLLGLAALRRRA